MSSASVDRFVKFLVMECEDTRATSFVDGLLDQAKEAIKEGNGAAAFVQAASGNGKSVTQASSLTCDEMAFACRTALRLYNDDAGSGPITFPDFTDMMR